MKYLKTFNESISDNSCEEVFNTVSDILLEISDMGYTIDIVINEWSYMWSNGKYLGSDKYNPKDDIKWINVEIWKKAPFTPGMDKIQEAFDRIKEYLKPKGLVIVNDKPISRDISDGLIKANPVHGHPNMYMVEFRFSKPISESQHQEYMKIVETEIEPIVDTINDILLDLTDENDWDMKGSDISARDNGWKVNVEGVGPLKNYQDKLGVLIQITKSEGFIRKQADEVSGRIDDYLKSLGYKLSVNKFDGYTLYLIYRYNYNSVN